MLLLQFAEYSTWDCCCYGCSCRVPDCFDGLGITWKRCLGYQGSWGWVEDNVRKLTAICSVCMPDLLLLNMKHSQAGATHLLLFSDFWETLFQLCLPCVPLKPLYQLLAWPGGHTKLNSQKKEFKERKYFLQPHQKIGILALKIALFFSKCLSILQTSHKTLSKYEN